MMSCELTFLDIIVFWLDFGGSFDLELVLVLMPEFYLGFHPL